MRFTVDSENSVLEEHRNIAGYETVPDFATCYPAASITAECVPVKATKEFTIDNQPLLFFSPDLTSVVVDCAVFSSGLKMVRATSLEPGNSLPVGRIEPGALKKIGTRKLALFLIHSGVIEIWVHIGAELELCSEIVEPDSEESNISFRGTHTYFTNEQVTEPVSFSVQIGQNGSITVNHF